MDIIFKMVGTEIIHNQTNMANVKSSCTQTCGYHNVSYFVLEVQDEPFSINLVLAAVQYNSLIANFVKLLKQIVSFNLFVDKYQH